MVQNWIFQRMGYGEVSAEKRKVDALDMVWDGVQWARKKAAKTGQWLWDLMGFSGNEAKKQAVSQRSDLMEALAWARKKATIAANWLWELMGFGGNEAAKAGVKAASTATITGITAVGEASQTAIVAEGEAARGSLGLIGTLKQIGKKAALAGASAFSWVMSEVPFPFNAILAPIAAVGAFAGTMAFGSFASARGGEWQVGEDGAPYVLHKDESVLPAGAADKWRRVVDVANQMVNPADLVAQAVSKGRKAAGAAGAVGRRVSDRVMASGAVGQVRAALDPKYEVMRAMEQVRARGLVTPQVTLPASLANIPAMQRRMYQDAQERHLRNEAAKQPPEQNKTLQKHELHVHTISAGDIITAGRGTLVKVLHDEWRKFAVKGGKK
jgi:hypothetical protein